MDFVTDIKHLAEKVLKMKDQIQTEEATKTAFIMPFVVALGYDIFDPSEVVPEYVADIGVKKGEKVDYAVLREGKPAILIECKHWKEDLLKHNEQLYRYFTAANARFGILTNGIDYMFFTDLVDSNKMDAEPFFQFDITNIRDTDLEELKKFHKSTFKVEDITSAAADLKYSNSIRNVFTNDLQNPSEDLVKYYISLVYPGRATEKIKTEFTDLVRKSVQQVISDLVTERLKNALTHEAEKAKKPQQESVDQSTEATQQEDDNKVIITEEELEAFQIVRAILRKQVPVNRIAYRGSHAWFSILLDDNNRKPLCRLYLNGTKKYIGLFDEQKKESKVEIVTVDDLFSNSESLEKAVGYYTKEGEQV